MNLKNDNHKKGEKIALTYSFSNTLFNHYV